MFSVRYLLPLGIFLLGCALLIIDGGGKTGWEGFFMAHRRGARRCCC